MQTARFDPGSLAQNKSIIINTAGTLLRQGALLEILGWTSNGRPARAGISLSYSLEPAQGGSPGAPRSLFETNQELSVPVGGLDPDTKNLLDELEKVKAAIGARRIRIDPAVFTARINAAISAINTPDPNLESIRAHVQSVLDLVGDQQIAGDLTGIIAQLAGVLEAINSNDIQIDTANIEDLLDDLRDRTLPDDLGISDTLSIAEGAPIPPAAQAPMDAIKATIEALRDGFTLQELRTAIDVLAKQIPLFEAAAPDPDLTNHLKLLKMRLEIQSETVPGPNPPDSGALFPAAVYDKGTHTNVIDTKGHTHFIATMSSVMEEKDMVRLISETGDVLELGMDDYKKTKTRTWVFDSGNSHIRKVWYGSIGRPSGTQATPEFEIDITWSEHPTIFDHTQAPPGVQIGDPGPPRTMLPEYPFISHETVRSGQPVPRIFQSYQRDDKTWAVERTSIIGTRGSNQIPIFLHASTARYIRVRITIRVPRFYTSEQQWLTDRDAGVGLDRLTFGSVINRAGASGTAYLSFEYKDNFGEWHPAITAAETGASLIQDGPPAIVRFSETQYGFPLPTGPDIFRARLDVIGGSISLRVAMLLLS